MGHHTKESKAWPTDCRGPKEALKLIRARWRQNAACLFPRIPSVASDKPKAVESRMPSLPLLKSSLYLCGHHCRHSCSLPSSSLGASVLCSSRWRCSGRKERGLAVLRFVGAIGSQGRSCGRSLVHHAADTFKRFQDSMRADLDRQVMAASTSKSSNTVRTEEL